MPETKSRYGCKVDGCEAHPSKGDAIIRTSPKGQPFAGACEAHANEAQRTELDADVATVAAFAASRVQIVHPLPDLPRDDPRDDTND